MLQVEGVEAGYGSSKVLFGIDLELGEGQLGGQAARAVTGGGDHEHRRPPRFGVSRHPTGASPAGPRH